MKLVSLELENIRSYKKAGVEFPEGVVLFEGDIGSGKSTLLYAIEFALFGLGELKAEHLLRHGAKKGGAELVFEVKGKEYKVRRGLEKKGRGFGQTNGSISVGGGRKQELSPSELKPAVLKILEFNESPRPNTTSVIYRYAVFTPQEEMKYILSLRDEERLQTLRRAFGIQEYKNAKDNCKLVVSLARENQNRLGGVLEDFDELVKEEKENSDELAKQEKALNELKAESEKTGKALTQGEARAKELEKQKEAVLALQTLLPELEKDLKEKEESLEEKNERIEKLEKQLKEKKEKVAELEKKAKPGRKAAEVEAAFKKAKQERLSLAKELAVLEDDLKRFTKLVENGECPTCNQEIKPKEFKEKISVLEGKVAEATRSQEEARKQEEALEKELEATREAELQEKRFKELAEAASEAEKELNEQRGKAVELEKTIAEIAKRLEEKRREFKENEKVFGQVEQAEKRLKEARDAFTAIQEKLGSRKTLVDSLKEKAGELEKKIKEKEEAKKKLAKTVALRRWLDEFFLPVLEGVEESVMAQINHDFNALFRKWMDLLMETEELEATINASFAPEIKQNGYDQDVAALSGGEKTAVALAYRLALNTLVKRETAGMEANLLILDEPTDGFSREQLQKMRDVFDELDCQQIILVSHEKELEAFADKIYWVNKKGGVSVVSE